MSKNNNNANKLISLGYEYDKENDIYYKNTDKKEFIKYQVKTNNLIIEKLENKNLKSITYYSRSKIITLSMLNDKSDLIINLKYNVPLNKIKCYQGNCENYRSDINYILKVYREMSTTLQ